MNTNKSIGTSSRRFLAVFLSLCLLLPGAALADGKNGKKNFKEGLKYEQLQQWDMAAQRFALALSAEPNNPEYKVHYLQALQRASLMYITRGDALAEQNDHSGAYVAYRQAYNYDPGNEIAKFKMERMLELQKAQASGTIEQISYNTKTGTTKPTSREIQVANKSRSRGDIPMDVVNFASTPFKQAIKFLAEPLRLNIVFDDAVADSLRVTINMENVTPAKAIDIILMQKKLAFEQVDRRTIFVYPDNNPGNRSRFEKLLIKTFYLNNISAQTAKNVLAQMLPPGRQAATVDTVGGTGGGDSNVLIVKATPAELQLVQDLISNIDKNKNEVVLDIEIYEVSNDSLIQIGNQFVTSPIDVTRTAFDDDGKASGTFTTKSPSLSNLGGIGLGKLTGGDTSIGGNLLTPFLGGIGTLFGLPPTQLSLLQSRGKSKLLHKTQIHVLDRGENETKVGRSVPVRLGTQLGNGINFGGLNGVNNNNNNGGIAQNIANGLAAGLGGFGGLNNGFDSIQYRDVGLVIKAKPTITNEGYVEIKMNFESSDVVASGADAQNLTPTFTQRSLSTVARIQDGVTAVVAGVNQDQKGDSRSGIPVLGMLPLIGRLFATPRQESRQTDVIITVTPHIIRSSGVTANDYLAHIGPPQTGGMNQSIEDVVNRAQVEEEQDQRLIAEQQSPGAPRVSGSAPTSQPANFNNQQRPGVSRSINYNGQQPQGAGSQPTVQPINNPNRGAIGGGLAPRSANPAGAAPPAIPEKRESETSGDPEDDGQPRPETNGDDGTPEPVAQDAAIASLRPEDVNRAVAKLLAEEKARRVVEPADNANSTVNFSLSPKPIRERLGKTFTVTVEVSGEQQMSGADIALKYDATKLQVKSVRDGGLFGSRPAFTYDYNKQGVLTVSVEHPQSAPTATSGRLVTIEFSAIGEGQSEIALSSGQTRARVGNAQIPVAGSSTQVIIGRGAASSSNEK